MGKLLRDVTGQEIAAKLDKIADKIGGINNPTKKLRFGVRISKFDSNPETRVEYIYDAIGYKPAHMDFAAGKFDYGDWADEWFVRLNKPLMLKRNGQIAYYLDPSDYTKKENGEASDVANEEFDGNAMAQFPVCWFNRYEDEFYEYEIVSNVRYDENYKAYAHTRSNGDIANYFYWSLFGGSNTVTTVVENEGQENEISTTTNCMRSIKGMSLSHTLTAQTEIDRCIENGAGWYTHTWSQRECIRTLLLIMGKNTNTQAVFGTGNLRQAQNAAGMLTTGTLSDKGQFFGYSDNTHQVKVFHIEKFWGDQWDRTAGLIANRGPIYVKMTPEGDGYRVTDVNGYTNTGVTFANGQGYIDSVKCTEYGILPVSHGGSETTYYSDYGWSNTGQLDYLFCGVGANSAAGHGGAFGFTVNAAPSLAYWYYGCGLSFLS